MQLVDLRVSVKEDGSFVIRFEGVIGSPAVSGIGIRRAPKVSGILSFTLTWLFWFEVIETLVFYIENFDLFKCNLVTVTQLERECLKCNNCAAEIDVPSAQVSCKLLIEFTVIKQGDNFLLEVLNLLFPEETFASKVHYQIWEEDTRSHHTVST